MKKIYAILTLLLCITIQAGAQRTRFYNLTSSEIRIDSLLPSVAHNFQLPLNHKDSLYAVVFKYPEYIDMTPGEIKKYKELTEEEPAETPDVQLYTVYSQARPTLLATWCPVVKRNNKYQYLVSYMIEVTASPAPRTSKAGDAFGLTQRLNAMKAPATPAERYADHSILRSGKWAKIRVSSSGIHQLTDDVIRSAGFNDLSKVKIYGYGGNLVPETLSEEYITSHDDLQEVPSCTVNGRRLFYANGPVYWKDQSTATRVRNPYSDYGYYFITQTDATPASISVEELAKVAEASFDRYHTLHEIDNYAWYEGGRNLVENGTITLGQSKNYSLYIPEGNTSASLTVATSSQAGSKVEVYLNDKLIGTQTVKLKAYDKANDSISTWKITNGIVRDNKLTIKTISGGPVRLDYFYATYASPTPMPSLANDAFPVPEYSCNITNQDLHADREYDMVIIVPTSQKTIAQANRLKELHEKKDGLKVRIVPADEIYNEFSSGTPDVSAYRRYMKMMYDCSPKVDGIPVYPKHLLLFGDCLWDNRMKTTAAASLSTDDYLLCYESENSYNEVNCYVSDDFIAMLDDDEAISVYNPAADSYSYTGIPDIGVGRIPVSTIGAAEGVVNKIIQYANGTYAGDWQNTLMFLGDDGNSNIHMEDINRVAETTAKLHPGYYIRKIMWDAFTMQKTSTGNSYPEITAIIKQQQEDGALIIDYGGHGSNASLSHEKVILLKDFSNFRGTNYPLWVTASCDIMPFDAAADNNGEYALLNAKGGAIGFYGTTRTVYSNYNYYINNNFINYVLSYDKNGRPNTLGTANRLTKEALVKNKQDLSVNKMQYSLLGDPALALRLPTLNAVIDSINGVSVANAEPTTIKAGSIVTIKGHISDGTQKVSSFNGTATGMVLDTKETITCKMNDQSTDGTTKAMTYQDRTKMLYHGSNKVTNGEFSFIFSTPKEINYDDGNGLITVYAISEDKSLSAHGETTNFFINGSETVPNDSIGPSIYCYLNTPDFTNGGVVNSTPFFVAQIEDKDGLNAAGSGIGHDMQLVIDGSSQKTYSLNKNFQYDFGSYQSGQTFYSIPALEPGKHTLRFRAWDNLNNPSTATLSFEVRAGLEPTLTTLYATPNPAKENVTFIISHNRPKSEVEVKLEVMDAAGRLLFVTSEEQMSSKDSVITTTWDLTLDNGAKVQTGIYLYRVSLSCDGSSWTSKAKKLIVVR